MILVSAWGGGGRALGRCLADDRYLGTHDASDVAGGALTSIIAASLVRAGYYKGTRTDRFAIGGPGLGATETSALFLAVISGLVVRLTFGRSGRPAPAAGVRRVGKR